jgi:hypothetical protein
MSLNVGATVGKYQIRALLGSGGMGEVYSALDPVLGRTVALKVLRPALGADADRLTRFLHEARAASALNHPNILTIHEVGEHEASRFIVAELVEGETVRHRLERGPLTLREILDIAVQTASALAAAHAAAIVHRDIKPDNLMLRPDGYVKVLDFGVATFARPATSSPDSAATIAPRETGFGMVVGTVAYMSPEQARGLDVDGRSDCFSLGVVLYELVTGRSPFLGQTTSDTLVTILDKEAPPLRLAARGLPLQLEWIIEKALEKDPALRYQNIADLRVDLLRLKTALASGRLGGATAMVDGSARAVDEPLELDLSEDSPRVRALSGLSWATVPFAAAAAAALIAALSSYHLARPGADLPLQLPEGAVLTKARDAVESLGYTAAGPRNSTGFNSTLDVKDVTAMAGLAAAREAIREGVVAQWSVGLTQIRDPEDVADGSGPQSGDFAIRLDPRGDLVGFSTGVPQEPAVAAERDRAAAQGLDALRQAFGIDASGYQFEYIQRAFPAGLVEMTWRNPTPRYGHIEQLRVHLHGDRVVRLDRSFEKPPGYSEPEPAMLARVFQLSGPFVISAGAVVAWGFGLFILFKTKNWDALTNRLPIAICALLLVQNGFNNIDGSWQSLLGVLALTAILAGTVLPALSGMILWVRRQSPERLWAADQMTHGRVFARSVSASLVDGVIAGAALASLVVLADLAALRVDGFVPSISREIDAVDAGIGSLVAGTLGAVGFLALGIALVVEALERLRLHPIVSTAIVAIGGGLMAVANQDSILAGLPLVAGLAGGAAIAVVLYRRRGFLAASAACLVAGLLIDAMAARSLEDPERINLSNMAFTVVAVLMALGVWGLAAAFFKRGATPVRATPSHR